jgi:hypothetical protein
MLEMSVKAQTRLVRQEILAFFFLVESIDSYGSSFLLFSPLDLILWNCGDPEEGEEPSGGKSSAPIQIRPSDAEFRENLQRSSSRMTAEIDLGWRMAALEEEDLKPTEGILVERECL